MPVRTRAGTTPRASPSRPTYRSTTGTRSAWGAWNSPRATWSDTPGSIALVYDDPHGHPHVFTGDCLFPGGVGNTRKDPEAFASLIHDVETKIFEPLPDESWVYPGHGNDTTLGAERPHLPEWHARGW